MLKKTDSSETPTVPFRASTPAAADTSILNTDDRLEQEKVAKAILDKVA